MAEQNAETKTEEKTQETTQYTFAVHDMILIHGLKSKPTLNDKFATIKAYSSTKGRYQVRLQLPDNKELNLLLKPDNLKLIYPNKWIKLASKVCKGIECSICSSSLSISNIISCPNCMSIYYCSNTCMKNHNNHTDLCTAYKQTIYTKYDMFHQRLGYFTFNVFDKKLSVNGIWMQTQLYKDYISHRNEIDETLISSMINNPKLLKSWKTWYEFHEIPATLPVAMRYYNPMTVYWIVQKELALSTDTNVYCIIHLIGVSVAECNTLYEWSELILLYPRCTFIFICFGPDIPVKWVKNGVFKLAEGILEFYFYPFLYDKKNINQYVNARYRIPNFVIGLNAGLGQCDGSWECAVKYIVKNQISAYFTEYALHKVLLECVSLVKECGGSVGFIEHNPFVAPCIMLDENKSQRCYRIGNNVIYGVNVNKQKVVSSNGVSENE
eukprot:119112_1